MAMASHAVAEGDVSGSSGAPSHPSLAATSSASFSFFRRLKIVGLAKSFKGKHPSLPNRPPLNSCSPVHLDWLIA